MEGFPQSFGSSHVGFHWKALTMFSKMMLNRAGLATILTPCGRLQGWQPGQEKKKQKTGEDTKMSKKKAHNLMEQSSQHKITGAGC